MQFFNSDKRSRNILVVSGVGAIGAIYYFNRRLFSEMIDIPVAAIQNPQGTGLIVGITGLGYLFKNVFQERNNMVRRGVAAAMMTGGILAAAGLFGTNQGYGNGKKSERAVTSTTDPGGSTTLPEKSTSLPTTAETKNKKPYVFQYADPRCQDLEPNTLELGETIGKLIKNNTLNSNKQPVFSQPDIDKIVSGQDFDSHPGISLDRVKEGWTVDINCAPQATTTSAAFITSSTVEFAWNPQAAIEAVSAAA
ncbi:MAG: hypothetical protein V4702_02360 [Patescibacteria group bacterium]